MKREGIQPVTRTFNTLMIACNTSNQWQESLRIYDELLAAGQPPNTTTFVSARRNCTFCPAFKLVSCW